MLPVRYGRCEKEIILFSFTKMGLLCLCFFLFAKPVEAEVKTILLPRVYDDGWKIELVDSEPNIVTPTACDVDKEDHLFVVECHTHFPPENYAGPKTDRIWVYIDNDLDGKFERRELFYEGGIATMSIACDTDGWVYVSSRSQIIRLKDEDGDFKSDLNQRIIQHDTKAVYPHNGLSSLLLTGSNQLMFGQGENFGDPYKVIGTDGSTQAGAGEGGNIYICNRDGSSLRRYATGFWNPFGLAQFESDYFVVDNDPDATPPNRLLKVTETGDFGFQFRFGRAGTNPLLSWNGEYPGTLGMTAGVGEAACAVQPIDDMLYVTSWGDNRIERFATASDKSAIGPSETFIQGSSMFRPVDFAVNSKGVVFVTDWVDRSYNVHGKGRIWKLTRDSTAKKSQPTPQPIARSDNAKAEKPWQHFEQDLKARLATEQPKSIEERVKQFEAKYLSSTWNATDESSKWSAMVDLYNIRWTWVSKKQSADEMAPPTLLSMLDRCIQSPVLEVRLIAIRLAAEIGDKQLLSAIQSRLNAKDLVHARELGPVVSAISYLTAGKAAGATLDPAREQVLKELLLNPQTEIEVQIYAMSLLSPAYKEIDFSSLMKMILAKSNRALTHQWISWLAARGDETTRRALIDFMESANSSDENLADAFAALASLDRQRAIELYDNIATSKKSPQLDQEASRAKEQMKFDSKNYSDRTKVDQWLALIDNKGNHDAGWRVWTRSQCVKCHAWEGRGATVGPELSSIAKGSSREQLLTSILQPSKEVAPLYVTWKVLTTDGRVIVGSKINGGGVGDSNRYLLADGTTVDIRQEDTEDQQTVEQSIMPDDIIHTLSIEELADLMEMFKSQSANQTAK